MYGQRTLKQGKHIAFWEQLTETPEWPANAFQIYHKIVAPNVTSHIIQRKLGGSADTVAARICGSSSTVKDAIEQNTDSYFIFAVSDRYNKNF